jgi:PAS domain S-box-containing protein
MTLIGNQIGVAVENAQLLEEIKESERKYKTLVEDINDGYIVCQDDKVIFANDAFCDMYGYGQEEVLGREVLDFFLQEASEVIGTVFQDQAESRSIPGHFEFLRRHRDGTSLPTELKINFVEFDGKPAMIGVVRDISERKRMEQKVRESERLASIGQLAAAIAHEIRNPLSAIKMNVQILANSLKLQGFNKRRLEIAADEIKRLERIVEDVLDFAGPIQTRAVAASINEVIKQCLELLSDIIPKKNVRILRKWSRTLDPVLMDCEKMEQAFLNIMLNAFDAMPDGGTLEIVTGHGDYLGRRMVRTEFKDTGIGLRPDQSAKIFEPFYTTKTTGVGLGLPNARKIIEAHNGAIEVESAVGAGTTFRVFLPAE